MVEKKVMEKAHKRISKILKFAIIFIIVLGALVAFTNLRELKEHFLSINPIIFFFGGLCALFAYILEGIFLFFALKLFHEKLPFLTALKYSIVINAVGYLVSFGGITPFATQIHILDYHNISPKKATLTRALHSVIFHMFFNLLLIFGYTTVLVNNKGHEFSIVLITITVFFFFTLLVLFYLVIFLKNFRIASINGICYILNSACKFFTIKRRVKPNAAIDFFNEFQEGCKNLVREPVYIFIMIAILAVDWVFLLAVMNFSFLSLNYPIKLGFLIIGFMIGQIVIVISMVPGGAGTMEGSMALTYKALGVPFETALAAVLIYRILFYIIPFFLSLPFYFSLKRANTYRLDA